MSEAETGPLVEVLDFTIENNKLDELREMLSREFVSEEQELLRAEKIDENTSKIHSFYIAEIFCRYICETFDINELQVKKVIKPIEGTNNVFDIDRDIEILNEVFIEGNVKLILYTFSPIPDLPVLFRIEEKVVSRIDKFRPICHLGKLTIVTDKPYPEGISIVIKYLSKKNRVSMLSKFVEGIFSYDDGFTTFCQ